MPDDALQQTSAFAVQQSSHVICSTVAIGVPTALGALAGKGLGAVVGFVAGLAAQRMLCGSTSDKTLIKKSIEHKLRTGGLTNHERSQLGKDLEQYGVKDATKARHLADLAVAHLAHSRSVPTVKLSNPEVRAGLDRVLRSQPRG